MSTVSNPRECESSSKKMKTEEEKNGAGTSKTNPSERLSALIVDDEVVIRMINSLRLEKLGIETTLAENGLVAVNLFRAGASFDVVFIDMEMPVMDGIQATRELRGMGVRSKIVGVTSRTSGPLYEAFMEAGLDICSEKPLDYNKIASILAELHLM